MRDTTRRRPGQTASTALPSYQQNITTASRLESQSRYFHRIKILIQHAEQLVVDMNGQLPETSVEYGVWHQLPNKKRNGVLVTAILVSDDKATYIDLFTGVVVTVDGVGRRKTSMIRGLR